MKFWDDMPDGTPSSDKYIMIGDPISRLPERATIGDFMKENTRKEILLSTSGNIEFAFDAASDTIGILNLTDSGTRSLVETSESKLLNNWSQCDLLLINTSSGIVNITFPSGENYLNFRGSVSIPSGMTAEITFKQYKGLRVSTLITFGFELI